MNPRDVFKVAVMVPAILSRLNSRLGCSLLPCILPRVFPRLPELRRSENWQHANHPGGSAFTLAMAHGVKRWQVNTMLAEPEPVTTLVDSVASEMVARVESMRFNIGETIPALTLYGARFSQFDNGAAQESGQWKPDGSLLFCFRLHFEVRGWHFRHSGHIAGDMLSHAERWTLSPAY